MIRIHLQTGTAWTKAIEVEGSLQGQHDYLSYFNLIQLINNYYEETGDLPVQMFTMEELMEIYDEDEIDGELENMIPINGGEFWIDGVSHVEEI